MRRAVTRLAAVATVLVTVPLAVLWASTTASSETTRGAPAYEYPVTRHADTSKPIPGVSVDISADKGQAVYLWARDLAAENVTPLGSGDNIGTTFSLECRHRDGTALDGERGTYWAANLVPPGEKKLTATLRWTFVAPAAGDYTCEVLVTSYSTIIVDGREVTMRVPAGASLAHRVYPASQRWTLPAESERTVKAGQSVTTLGFTYRPTTSEPKLAVVQDTNLTTCKAGSSICDGGSPGNSGSKVTTQVVAKLLNEDGTACGADLKSPAKNGYISTAKHHWTSTNTLYIEKSQLGNCPRLRLSLSLRVTEGNPVVIHAGFSVYRARTHGTAFEYS
ncbi:hypothetical protein [Stackebrandtia nassauensis]|uniref:Uncharacterized protein n=1 Tax=Stackebrandtia nassauensis (strain DSM 44728 / CIP 108903 / NRRL B-16338 / NBRC 102104 / LLR-40K-21) TaxID=446470 RepID=D3PX93_STANL|nr:hypothetical protein [Stackebrandtia nassauensis]ADD41356.1 hypothetical protein Snas_1654 [Stackebrandtia nassauensis DSM 44728]